jgi:hypothetical protein
MLIRQHNSNLGAYISIFGVFLLLLKLLSVPVGIGYFFILCIILWPVTIVVGWFSFIAAGIVILWILDYIGEKM